MMSTVTISIGRNVGEAPMSAREWRKFRGRIGRLVEDVAEEVYVTDAKCVGSWEGIPEESRTWVALIGKHSEVYVLDIVTILAGMFGQDVIAVTFGETHLVGPRASHATGYGL